MKNLFSITLWSLILMMPTHSHATEEDDAQAVVNNDSCTRELMQYCSNAGKADGSGDLAACIQMNRKKFSELCLKPRHEEEPQTDDQKHLGLSVRAGYGDIDFSNVRDGSGSGLSGGASLLVDYSFLTLRPEFYFLNAGGDGVLEKSNWTRFTLSAKSYFIVLHEFETLGKKAESYDKLMAGLGFSIDLPILGTLTPSVGFASLSTDWFSHGSASKTGFYLGASLHGENGGLAHEIRFSYAKAGSSFANGFARLFYGFGAGLFKIGPEVSIQKDTFLLREDTTLRASLRLDI